MVGHRTVLMTVESFLVFSRMVKRRQVRPRMAARWLDARSVFLDACHYARCQLQSGAPGNAIGSRLFTSAYCVQKGFQLRAQGFDPRGGQFLKGKLGLGPWPLDADTQSVATRVIQGNVFVLLEEAYFANPLGGNAAGGDVGDRAAGKFQASVCDVYFVAEHRNTDSFHFD